MEDCPPLQLLVRVSTDSEDRPMSLEQQVRLHGVHSKSHAYKHGHHQGGVTGGGDSGATVVTAVVSICVLAGLLFSVVLSRWRTNGTSSDSPPPRRGLSGYGTLVLSLALSISAIYVGEGRPTLRSPEQPLSLQNRAVAGHHTDRLIVTAAVQNDQACETRGFLCSGARFRQGTSHGRLRTNFDLARPCILGGKQMGAQIKGALQPSRDILRDRPVNEHPVGLYTASPPPLWVNAGSSLQSIAPPSRTAGFLPLSRT
ncbi:hypothetical protein HPB51_010965 [Rhipicephalus microplus]|uniref:Uncharacterized protein n=1 Tax=Rhipicephalus microplus TaxID=6941 RepID=A0A9J6DUJ9_RHIMP|nr:hypothetical protein HPB51_010965 [Rhipicephalus microplus]